MIIAALSRRAGRQPSEVHVMGITTDSRNIFDANRIVGIYGPTIVDLGGVGRIAGPLERASCDRSRTTVPPTGSKPTADARHGKAPGGAVPPAGATTPPGRRPPARAQHGVPPAERIRRHQVLGRAVLRQAAVDFWQLRRNAHRNGAENAELHALLTYFLENDHDSVFSLANVCEMHGLDVDYVRRRILFGPALQAPW